MKTKTLGIFLTTLVGVSANTCNNVFPQVSCGILYTTESACTSAGCCWDANAAVLCFVPSLSGYSFTMTNEQESKLHGTLDLKESSDLFNGIDFSQLSVDITQETNLRTYIKIAPVGVSRWEVPDNLLPRPGGIYNASDSQNPGFLKSEYSVALDPFSINVERKSAGVNPNAPADIIFNMSGNFVFQDQYLQFELVTPSDVIASFGFGESTRTTQMLQDETTYTLWNTDTGSLEFDKTLYGTHPFLLQVKESGRASGFLFVNSNAIELSVTRSDSQGQRISIQSTGGIIELYVFAGSTPEEVVRQLQEVVGRPSLVPYWSLGFHNCRWGYSNLDYVKDVVANYSAANIPLETQWMDIDYMDAFLDFTFDPTNFPQSEVAQFVDDLHSNGQRFVPIVDPGIFVGNSDYPAFSEGVAQDVFILDQTGDSIYLGQVWPGSTYFPDWFAPNTQQWWTDQFAAFYEMVQYDGIWIDMNEVSNFCNEKGVSQVCQVDPDSTCPDGCCLNCTTPQPTNTYDFPPYVPNVSKKTLGGKTVAMSSIHSGGILEYDAHNLFGFMESIATRKTLISVINKRPFLLSRSSYLGSGVHTAHWTGDNAAEWTDLAASIVTMNNMALFGIPMIGADICGFNGDTTEELCARWIEVGAFSPFSRDHNAIYALPQELYRWSSVAEASRSVLGLRYQLLPHLYTLMFLSSKLGNTVHNAMWMHFPWDQNTLSQDGQYMWGASMLFTPVLQEGAVSVRGYFPQGIWYSMFDNSAIDHTGGGGAFVTLDTALTATNVHVRGGHIIPMQSAGMTTSEVYQSPFKLLVALGGQGLSGATGALFIDDGEQVDIDKYILVEYLALENSLKSMVMSNSFTLESALLASVEILGVSEELVGCTITGYLESGEDSLVYPSSMLVTTYEDYSKLTITFDIGSTVNVATDFTLAWSCLGNDDAPPSDDTDSSSSGSDKGWDSIARYGQILIIISSIVVVLALAATGYYCYQKKKDGEPLLPRPKSTASGGIF